jgi:hypothetical protein
MIESRDICERLEEIAHYADVDVIGGGDTAETIREAIATIKAYRAVVGRAQGNPSDAFQDIRRQAKSIAEAPDVREMRPVDHSVSPRLAEPLSPEQRS